MKRTQSEDREAQNGQRAISASTDYLNKKSKDFMVRNNPLGLAEPSMKRDGYAVGSREGSMYRSTGNLNVSSGVAGSRAGSESKDLPKGNWKERRASTSDLKGSGIRVGGWQQSWLRKQRPSKRQLEGEEGVDLRSEGIRNSSRWLAAELAPKAKTFQKATGRR